MSVFVVGVYAYTITVHRYSRERSEYMAREARAYDRHSNGKGSGLLLFSSLVVSVWEVAIAVIPYQLTLKAINSKRLSGED